MESTLVIKVKYSDTLRRFNARVNENDQLDLDIDGLKSKILGLFNFPVDADLTLTYIDEDGDVVTLVDDDDLHDVMRQNLKFLRIDVQLNNEKFGKSYARSSGSSTPMRYPHVHNPLPNLNSGVADVMRSVPEPLHETLSKLSLELASKAAISTPKLAEPIDCVSKTAQPYLSAGHQSQVGADSSIQSGLSEIPKPPSMPTVPNASNDGSIPDILSKAKSTGNSGDGINSENVISSVDSSDTIVSDPVDLNQVPPFDSNPSGCKTFNFEPDVSLATANGGGNGSRNQNGGLLRERPACSGESSFGTSIFRSFAPLTSSFAGKPLDNECPLGGIPYGGLFKRSNTWNDAMAGMFHKGVQCDGCGIHPITGLQYKSKVKENYDLCSICFAQIGNEVDYIKMDRPALYWHERSFKSLHDPSPNIRTVPPPLPNVIRTCGMRSARPKLDSHFLLDVNILDGTIMAPCTSFTKIWRVRNSGSVAWPQGSKLVWIDGDGFSHADAADMEIPVKGVPVDGELDVAVDFTSPQLPGRYISYWRMASPSGTKFGQLVWVLIQVDASLRDSCCDSLQGLNLNLPPDCSGSNGPEIVDMSQPIGGALEPTGGALEPTGGVLEPTGGVMEPPISTSMFKPVETELVEQAKKDQELNFPINDNLLVGHYLSASASPKNTSSASYPIIDLSEEVTTGPSQGFPAIDAINSSKEFNVNDAVEKDLLKELEEMGFKQVDLYKEILRLNEYNLEQSLDDLCDVGEWDPILQELQEMFCISTGTCSPYDPFCLLHEGFCDKEMNRKLLKKNNGSIKRVVMDLLLGEKV